MGTSVWNLQGVVPAGHLCLALTRWGNAAQETDATCCWRCCRFLCQSHAWNSSHCKICPCPCAWRSIPQCHIFVTFPWLGVSASTCPLACWGQQRLGFRVKWSPRSCCWCSPPYQRTWDVPSGGWEDLCVFSFSVGGGFSAL